MLNMLEFLTLNLSKMLAACHSKIVNSFKIIDSLMVAVRFFLFLEIKSLIILRFFSNILLTYVLLTFSEHVDGHHHFVCNNLLINGRGQILHLCAHLFILFSSNDDKGGTVLNFFNNYVTYNVTKSTQKG